MKQDSPRPARKTSSPDDRDDLRRQLELSEDRYRDVEAIAGIGSWSWDISGDVVTWSEGLYRIFGLKPDQFEATFEGYLSRVHPEDRDLARANVEGALASGEGFSGEVRVLWPDGTTRWLHTRGAVVTDREGAPRRMTGTCQDVTEAREAMNRWAEASLRDALTGLPNRALVLDRLEQALHRSERHRVLTGVAFIDLDGLKQINDNLGHAGGDQALKTLGLQLAQRLRRGDTVGRIGGDEFLVVCEDLPEPDALVHTVGRLVQPVQMTAPSGVEVSVTVSTGLALADADDTPASVVRNADAAMYRAKRRGRGLIELFAARPSDAQVP